MNVLDAGTLLTHMEDTMHKSVNIVPPVKAGKWSSQKSDESIFHLKNTDH